ncbi:PLP-dependent aminotransferase family protein [Kitasatospora sp. MAP12-22]
MTGTATLADAGPALVASTGRSAAPAPAAAPRLERPSGALALRKRDLHQSLSDPVLDTMNFLNEITDRYPDAISFAPGRPYEEFYDLEQVFDYVRRYVHGLAEQGMSKAQVVRSIYQYGPAAGQIREVIAQWLREDEGIDVPAESLVVTVGCQEAMFLVLRALFARPEDVLLVSSPCYVGLTGAASLLDIDVLAIEEGDQGFSGTAVEDAVRRALADGRRPRALYVVPDHSNPSGNTMSLAARAELLELAGRHGILLLEDSPYRLVSPGERLPSLKALDREHRVIHLGSFSKTVFPGARVGFAVADQPVEGSNGERSLLADEIAKIKSMVTVNTSSLSQAAVAGALMSAGGLLSSFNPAATDFYANAMQLTVQALAESFPADRHDTHGVSWNEPSGGFFLTVRVPFRADADALARSAQRFGVVWTPMSYFHPSGGGEKALRLSVSYLAPERLTEGVARLVRFIRSELG